MILKLLGYIVFKDRGVMKKLGNSDINLSVYFLSFVGNLNGDLSGYFRLFLITQEKVVERK